MKLQLGLQNLLYDPRRTAVATAGVTFAVVLMFLQLGFLQTANTTASVIYESLRFDVCVVSTDYYYFADPRDFGRARLYQAASVDGVEEVQGLNVGIHEWRNDASGETSPIIVLGLEPESPVFSKLAPVAALQELSAPHHVLIDTESRPELGPASGERFGEQDLNDERQIGDRIVRIVGMFQLGSGFAASGAVLTSAPGFQLLFPYNQADRVSIGLVRLEEGVRVREAAREMAAVLPDDVQVLTRKEVLRRERDRWVNQTSYGHIFRLGCAIAFVVGTGIVYQILSSDVAAHRAEYATLKAMGYRNGYLNSVVLQQAVALAVLGILPGILISLGLYAYTAAETRIPITMTLGNLLLVTTLTLGMCLLSGVIALKKVRQAEPAELF
jgi:putative ABC transport system permease protein